MMSTDSLASTSAVELLRKTNSELSGSENTSTLSSRIFPDLTFTDPEKVETQQWLSTSHELADLASKDEAKAQERLSSLNTLLSSRSTLLGSKPSLADIAVYQSLAPQVKTWSPEDRTGEKGYSDIVRFVDFVENSPIYDLKVSEDEKVNVDVDDIRFRWKPVDAKAEKEKKKKEKAAAVAEANANSNAQNIASTADSKDSASLPLRSGTNPLNLSNPTQPPSQTIAQPSTAASTMESPPEFATTQPSQSKKSKEKKPKAPKQPAPPPVEKALSPCLIDLRVGRILKAIPHPNADSLYVSTVACGDPAGADNTSEYEGQVVRTVCSGLNGLVPLEEMQGRKIVAVCNLKPVTMRGVKSAAMVLAASPRVQEGEDSHKGPVELVDPPAGVEAGERVWFEGWEGEPEGQLNPKKKVWEMLQPGFGTGEEGEVKFEVGAVDQLKGGQGKDGRLVVKGGGGCTVKTLKGATVR